MQDQTYQLYIGADNITGDVNTRVIEVVLNTYFDGYTLVPSVGYWLGKRKNSIVATITTDANTLKTVLAELKTELKQDAIAWQQVAHLQFF